MTVTVSAPVPWNVPGWTEFSTAASHRLERNTEASISLRLEEDWPDNSQIPLTYRPVSDITWVISSLGRSGCCLRVSAYWKMCRVFGDDGAGDSKSKMCSD